MLSLIPRAPFTLQTIAIRFLPCHVIETALAKDNTFKIVNSNGYFYPFFFLNSTALDDTAMFSFSKRSLNKYTSFALCIHNLFSFPTDWSFLFETLYYLFNLNFILSHILKLKRSCGLYFQRVPDSYQFLLPL